MSHPRAATSLIAFSLALGLVSGRPARADESLLELVPGNACAVQYVTADKGLAFAREYQREVLHALCDAGFDDIALSALEVSELDADKVKVLRGIRDAIAQLVRSVDWTSLLAGGHVSAASFGEWSRGALPDCLFAARVEAERVESLEQSLAGVLRYLAAVAPDALSFHVSAEDAQGTRLHQLRNRYTPLLQMAVRGDVILLGFGEELFSSSLALLEGRPGPRLVESERFRLALGDVPEPRGSSLCYMDIEATVSGCHSLADGMLLSKAPYFVKSLAKEFAGLTGCFETRIETTRAEGHTIVTESWVRCDAESVRADNPLYRALVGPGDSSELLAFVPAEALAFSVRPARDFVPLYRWLRESVVRHVPESREALVGFDLAEAVLGLHVDRDLLSCLGSASVSITLPSQRGDDFVSVTRLQDKAAAQRLLERAHDVLAVVETRVLGGELGAMLRKESHGMLPTFEIVDVQGSYPGLRRLKIGVPVLPIPIPELTYGFVGNLFVTTTSVDALQQVMDTAAGEEPGLSEHPGLQRTGLLPSGPVVSAEFTPLGRLITQARRQAATSGWILQSGLSQAARQEKELAFVQTTVTGLTRSIDSILAQLDYLEDGVCWSEIRDEGLVLYTRTNTRCKTPDERRVARATR